MLGDASADKSGFYVDALNMITGAGWISGGPGYRWWLGGDRSDRINMTDGVEA